MRDLGTIYRHPATAIWEAFDDGKPVTMGSKTAEMQRKDIKVSGVLPQGNVASWMLATRERTTGFDYMRIILACLVILSHSRVVTYGCAAVNPTAAALAGNPPVYQPVMWAVVPSFFILSGFLVAGSLMRAQTIFEFGMLRVLRIVPALFVETIIAAFILGPLLTDLPLRDYFSGSEFWHYPLNIVGDIHYFLPGVFTHNPAPNVVNVQLWTIPIETLCWISLVVFYLVVALISKVWPFTLKTAIGLLTLGTFAALMISMFMPQDVPKAWHEGGASVSLNSLWLGFLLGVSAYYYRDRIPLRFGLLIFSLVAAYAFMYDGKWQYFGMIAVAYAVIYLGLTNFRRTFITRTGDFSYGIYLYGFPVQQTFAYLFPHVKIWELNYVVSLCVSFVIAGLSWHFVESRVLANRKTIIATTGNFFRVPVPKWR